MRLRNLLSKLFGQSARKNRASKSASERQTNRSLRMESLEGRALMATLTGTEPPLLDHIAPPPPAGYFGLPTNGCDEDDDDIKHGTVTVTLQATNDAPLAPMAPNYAARTNNDPAPIVFNPLNQLNINGVEEDDDDIKHGTVTVTLQATNDAPLAPIAPSNTGTL